jgi:hypothetical protein
LLLPQSGFLNISTPQIPSIFLSCNKIIAFCNKSGRDQVLCFALFATKIFTDEPDKIYFSTAKEYGQA